MEQAGGTGELVNAPGLGTRTRYGHLGEEKQFKLSVLEEPTTNHHRNTVGRAGAMGQRV